jgi:DNA-binding beta-propeller fold protein YncE
MLDRKSVVALVAISLVVVGSSLGCLWLAASATADASPPASTVTVRRVSHVLPAPDAYSGTVPEPSVLSLPTPVDSLHVRQHQTLTSEYGVKSVLFNPAKTNLYALNLEGLSIYDFDRASRTLRRYIRFRRTPSKGYDYEEKKIIESFEEKPVEGFITHQGRYLWVSLHNGGCIAVWDLEKGSTAQPGKPFKLADEHVATGVDPQTGKKTFTKQELRLLTISTGKTPKIIGGSPDGKYLFVTNWHSQTTSVIDISSPDPSGWSKIKDLANGAIPRGLAVSPDSKKLYVAIMGGNYLQEFDLATLTRTRTLNVGAGPRHIVLADSLLYISLNAADEIIRYNLRTQRVEKRSPTGDAPRTIILSDDRKFLFVTCYKSHLLEVYDARTFKRLGRYPSPENPVGVDLYQDDKAYEAWVCNYTRGTISVFVLEPR